MRVLVCGSRTFTDAQRIRQELARLPRNTTIIHGAARGADSLAAAVAEELGLRCRAFPVTPEEWRRLGKKAGPLRNQRMLDEGRPHKAIAFVQGSLQDSRGTRDMVRRLEEAGIPVQIIEVFDEDRDT